jgi:hypothetical protein
MRKLAAFLSFLLFTALLQAQGVSFIRVTDEAQYKNAQDFTNTYEINLLKEGGTVPSKCQAVRIERSWYITAAHCLFPMCDNKCDIQVRLAVTPYYEMDMAILHTKDKPRVFKNPRAAFNKKTAAYDIALIHMPPKSARHIFLSPARKAYITEAAFLKMTPDYNVYYKAVNGTNLPEVLSISSNRLRTLNREVSAVSIWDGRREVLPAEKSVFYSPKKRYLFTENFGVIKGLSGSGIMTNTGELVGIISAIGTINIAHGENNTETLSMLFISPFDDYVTDFIKEHIPAFTHKKADASFLKTVPAKYKTMAEGLNNM